MAHDPYRNFRFRVEIDGIQAARFSEVVVGASTIEVLEYREGTDPTAARKLGGLTRYGNITLRRGLTDSKELFQWFKATADTGVEANRRHVSVVVLDDTGADKVRFEISRAWPTRYHVGELDALHGRVLIEELELADEGIAWV
jgi:phage tail-like protein